MQWSCQMLIPPSMNKDSNSLQVEMCILFSAQVLISRISMTAKASYSSCASSVLPLRSILFSEVRRGEGISCRQNLVMEIVFIWDAVSALAVWPHAPCQWKTARKSPQKNDRELVAFCFFISFHNLELRKASTVIVFSMIYAHSSCASWVLTQTVTFLFMNMATVEIK